MYVEYETNHLAEDIVKLILDLFTVDSISLVGDVET